jgi:uncharacterized ubiquitin-like protein YukD
MNDMVTVDIKTPQNEIWEGSVLPLDFNFQMIIDELIENFELPRLDDSARPISYVLRSAQQGRVFASHETVQSAQISNGDTLELQIGSAQPSPGVPPPIPETQHFSGNQQFSGGNQQYSGQNQQFSGNQQYSGQNQPPNYSQGGSSGGQVPPTVYIPNAQEINVVLSVMDLNRHETVSFPVMVPIGELIRQIVTNYNLDTRDKFNQIVKYKLQSKALGRLLDERMTLSEAQIPPLDRLTLHRDEIAGSQI